MFEYEWRNLDRHSVFFSTINGFNSVFQCGSTVCAKEILPPAPDRFALYTQKNLKTHKMTYLLLD